MAGNLKVLYIGDDQGLQLDIQNKLSESQLPWSVTFVSTMEEALLILNKGQVFDLFVAEGSKVGINDLSQFNGKQRIPLILLNMQQSQENKQYENKNIHHIEKDEEGRFLCSILEFVEKKKNRDFSSAQYLSNKKILIGEDNPMNKKLIFKMLEQWNLKPTILDNGQLIIDELEKQEYDLLLIDLQMPVKDGISTINYIRSVMKLDIKIILMTAVLFEEAYMKVLPLIEGMLPKPFTAENLYGHIKKSLLKDQGLTHVNRKGEKAGAAEKLYDLSFLENTARGNMDFVREMIEIFIQQVDGFCPKIQALMHDNDTDQLSLNIHTIKSSARHVGCLELSQLCEDIESNLMKTGLGERKVLTQFKAFSRLCRSCSQQLKDALLAF